MGPKVRAACAFVERDRRRSRRSARSRTRPRWCAARRERSSRRTRTASSWRTSHERSGSGEPPAGEEPLHAPVRVHDPVRADRPGGDRDVDHPRRHVRPQRRRRADSRHVPRGRCEALADRRRLAHRPDQRPLRHRGREGEHQLLQLGDALRRDRHRAVHPRDRRLPRHHDEDGRDPGGHRDAREADGGSRAPADPCAHVRLRARRHDVRDGGGEPGVLRARDHGADRRGLRRAHRRRRRAPRLRHRHARIDDQPVRDGHRLGDRRHPDQRGPARADRDPDRRPRDRDRLRHALRRTREAGSVEVRGLRPEGRERGALRGRERVGRHHAHRHAQGRPRPVRARVRRDDLRRHPVGGPRDPDPHAGGGGSRR